MSSEFYVVLSGMALIMMALFILHAWIERIAHRRRCAEGLRTFLTVYNDPKYYMYNRSAK